VAEIVLVPVEELCFAAFKVRLGLIRAKRDLDQGCAAMRDLPPDFRHRQVRAVFALKNVIQGREHVARRVCKRTIQIEQDAVVGWFSHRFIQLFEWPSGN